MRQTVCLLILVASLFAGCADDQAARDQAARRRFVHVLEMIAKTDQGYVPRGEEAETSFEVGGQSGTQKKADLQAYRQKNLDEAAQQLKSILNEGSKSQQVSARRLLADVYTSQARYKLRRAMSRWADLANRSTALISYLGSVDRANWRVHLFNTDDTLLIAELEKDRQATQNTIAQLKDESARQHQITTKLTRQIQEFRAESHQHAQQAQQQRGQALVSTDGTKQYDLYNLADALNRQANTASAAAQELDAKLDVAKSEQVVLSHRDRIAQQAIKTLEQQLLLAKQRQTHQLQKQAVAAKNDAVQQLMLVVNEISDRYTAKIDTELDRAADKMTEAMGQLTGLDWASDQDKHLMQLERLGHMADMAHVLAEHIMVAGNHGHTLSVVAQQANRLIPDQAALLLNKAVQIHAKQRKLIEASKQMISDATAICDQLTRGAAPGDSVADFAKHQTQRLEAYRDQIDQHRMAEPQT